MDGMPLNTDETAAAVAQSDAMPQSVFRGPVGRRSGHHTYDLYGPFRVGSCGRR